MDVNLHRRTTRSCPNRGVEGGTPHSVPERAGGLTESRGGYRIEARGSD